MFSYYIASIPVTYAHCVCKISAEILLCCVTYFFHLILHYKHCPKDYLAFNLRPAISDFYGAMEAFSQILASVVFSFFF
jgi:hypothetical protein